MPYLPGESIKRTAQEVVKIFREGDSVDEKEFLLRDFFKKQDIELVGVGSEKIVFDPKNNFDRKWWHFWKKKKEDGDVVFVVNHDSVTTKNEASRVFYMHKLMHLLFPNNFPKVYSCFGKTGQELGKSGSVREKIKPSKNKKQKIEYPIAVVEDAINEIRLPVFELDRGDEDNFIVSGDGGQYYLDDLIMRRSYRDGYPEWPDWSIDKLIAYMTDKNYSNSDINRARKIASRIQKLTGE